MFSKKILIIKPTFFNSNISGANATGTGRKLPATTTQPPVLLGLPRKLLLPAVLILLSLGGPAIAQTSASIEGKVTDSSGAPIWGAVIAVEGADGIRRTTTTDGEGAFKLVSLTPGDYNVKISASGLSDWTASNIPVVAAAEPTPLLAVLQVAPQLTTVTVGLSSDEVATEQLHQELKQRALGVLPNYFVTYESNPAPLSSKQKLHLSLATILDPATIGAVGITAGIQQVKNSYYQFGQGTEGYAKRFGAAYATASQSILITSVLADSVLHQDPRYFYSGQGTKVQRAWYAVKSAFRAKGDNGKWQPPYAGVIGLVASAELSQVYYPGSRTQYSLLGRSLMFHFAGLVALNLGEEFLLKKVTTHTPHREAAMPVLREGTPVSLIALDAFSTDRPAGVDRINFVVTEDVIVRGEVLARTGDVASAQVSQVSTSPDGAKSVVLQGITLRAGDVNVPLRSTQIRGPVGPMQYKELPESGKMEVTLFVAENVKFPETNESR